MQALLYTQTMESPSASANANQRSSNDRLLDWRTVLLALAIVEISSSRLVVTKWTPFLYFTQTMGFIGLILGVALGYSNFSRQTVIRLVAGYTLLLIPAQLLLAIVRTDWLWRDITVLLNRLFISLDQFVRNKPINDSLFFISIVTLGYWIIGLSAGYWLTRHKNFLIVVIPSGLAILTVQAFDLAHSKHIWELGLFIFASLLLLGRIYFLQNHSFWKKKNFLLTDEAINDLERGALAITALAVFIAWSIPGWISSIKPAAQAWKDASQPVLDKFSNAVSALDSPYAGENSGGDFYGDSLSLGQKAAIGDIPVFTVDTKGNKFVPVRSYWKGRVYDLYLNGHWTNASNSNELFIPTIDELSIEYPDARHEMEYTFTNRAKYQSLFYSPAETIWNSKRSTIFSTPISAEMKDVSAWVATSSLLSGSQYKVRTLIADPSIEELRATGTDYPTWVTDRYLQVPKGIAQQLRELTLEITAPYETNYDKVQAVTSYLRNEIKYETKITVALPKNQDPVMWVLFDYKKGFCMYYASAETLMLRSIGIPARMAVGFVEGAYDELELQYTVTYKDSHAWPEVYFPGIGWVEFEPTSNQFPIKRPETKNTGNDETTSGGDLAGDLNAHSLTPVPATVDPRSLHNEELDNSSAAKRNLYAGILISMLILLTLGLGIFIVRRYSLNERLPVYLADSYKRRGSVPPLWVNRWIRWTNLSPIERAFQAINLSLFWLGHPQPADVTSQKRAEVLIEHLPSAQDQTLSLLKEYHTATYTPRPGNLAVARSAAITLLLKTLQFRIKETLQSPDTRYNQLK
jgi:transglutaminase-like putative cysteine protease